MVTLDGSDGSGLDHWILTSPTLATYTLSPCSANPLRVSRTDCRLSLRERKRGWPTLRPFLFPDKESNQFRYARRASWQACTSTTDATSLSHSRSEVTLASVTTRRCTSVSESFSPASCAASRSRSASLNT